MKNLWLPNKRKSVAWLHSFSQVKQNPWTYILFVLGEPFFSISSADRATESISSMAPSPVILVMAALFLQAATMAATTALTVSLPGCPSSCGSMVIPYPFGVGAGCHLAGFAVTCNRSYHPPKLFLRDADAAEVLEISLLNSTVIVSSAVRYDAAKGEGAWGRGLAGAFRLRERRNRLVVVGCNLQAVLLDGDDIAAACTTICGGAGATWPAAADGELADYSCAGVGCCQASIYLGLTSYGVRLSPFGTSTGPPPPPPTSSASSSNQSDSALVFVADNEWFGGNASKLGSAAATMRPGGGGMPVALAVLDWAIGKSGCPPHGPDDTACSSSNSYCRNSTSTSLGGYSCQCDNGYQGNPYVANGCQGNLLLPTSLNV